VSTGREVVKATGLVAAVTLVSKLTGFARTLVLADVYGATCLTDSYVAATVYPSVLFAGINSALATTFIPLYTDVRERDGPDQALRFANVVLTALFAALMVLLAVGFATALPVLPLYAPGFVSRVCLARPQVTLTLQLTWIMLPALLFIAMAGVQTGILQAERRFGPPAAVGIPQNLLLIAAIALLAARWSIFAAAVGSFLGGASYVVVQGIALRRLGFRFRPTWDLGHPVLRRMGRMVLPVFLSTFVAQAGYIVDRLLASSLKSGSLSDLNYALLVNGLLLSLFVTALVTVLYPTLARYIAQGDEAGFVAAVRRSLGVLALVTVPVAAAVIVLAEPFVRVVFQRGAFTGAASAGTAFALVFLAVGLVASAAGALLPRAFFALKDTRTPTMYALISVGVNIVADLLLVHPLKQGGLALGTSIAQWVFTGIMLWRLRRRVGPLGGARLLATVSKALLGGAVMAAVLYLGYHTTVGLLPHAGRTAWWEAADLLVVGAAGVAAYAAVMWRLGPDEVVYLTSLAGQGFRRLVRAAP
jgi:putative peptidoglycan lipid II flippase